MQDKLCLSDHKLHICSLAEEKNFDEIRTLIMNPRYVCENCGRAADKSENLCNPKPINPIGLM